MESAKVKYWRGLKKTWQIFSDSLNATLTRLLQPPSPHCSQNHQFLTLASLANPRTHESGQHRHILLKQVHKTVSVMSGLAGEVEKGVNDMGGGGGQEQQQGGGNQGTEDKVLNEGK